MFLITPGDFTDARVLDLIGLHHARAHAASPPGSAHALDIAGLRTPDIQFWTLWVGEDLLGIGALKRLAPRHGLAHGEVKSMHTAEAARRRGVAVDHPGLRNDRPRAGGFGVPRALGRAGSRRILVKTL